MKSKEILNALSLVLTENPNLELKITSHTDSRGQSTYNKWLSERRVNRTLGYLVSKGIAAHRLSTEAYGEEQLVNDCDDNTYCPEEQHKINRRSEFVVVNY